MNFNTLALHLKKLIFTFVDMKLRELDIMGFIQLIVYALLGENIKVLGSPQVFDESIL